MSYLSLMQDVKRFNKVLETAIGLVEDAKEEWEKQRATISRQRDFQVAVLPLLLQVPFNPTPLRKPGD